MHPLSYGSLDGPKADKTSWAFKWAEERRGQQREARQLFRVLMRFIDHHPDCPMNPRTDAWIHMALCTCGLVGLVRRNW